MDKIKKRIYSSAFLKNIMILASGSIIAQGINFISSPVITRLYSPEIMGDFTYILTIITLFGTVINGRYDISIVNEKEEEGSVTLITLSAIVCLFFSVLISIASCFYVKLNNPEYFINLGNNLFWIFPLLMIAGIINILNAYNNRQKEYKLLTKVYVVRSLSQNLSMIILGFFHPVAFVLLFCQFIGQFFGIIKQSEALRKDIINYKLPNIKTLVSSAKHYYKQPLYSVPATFLNSFAYSFINFLIGAFYGNVCLGLYSISYRVLGIPLSVFSSNIARIHLENSTSEYEANKNFYHSTLKTFKFSLLLAIPMMIFLIICSPLIFEFIFGTAWKEAGVYVQILAPMFALRMITGCLGFSFVLSNQQQLEFFFQILLVIALVLTYIFVSIFHLDIIEGLFLISMLFSVVYVMEIFSMIKLSKT